VLKKNKQKVWDVPVRVLHWLLVLTVAAAWLSSSRIGPSHEYLGYGTGAIVLLRLIWGFAGNRHARFSGFIRPAAATLQYLREVSGGRAARYLGHNPLGGWMVVAVLACISLLVLTGWAATTDLLWGYAWPVQLHAAVAWSLAVLITLHITGVLLTSWQHHENLAAAMFTGNKAPPASRDVE
jgi:cytochrome b